MRLIVAAIALLLATCLVAQTSSVPPLMNYQGKLTKPDGSPVEDGQFAVRFSIHDALTGGTERWFQTMDPVLVRNGVFSVLLGSGNPLSADVFSGVRYLEIKVGTAAPLSPRQPIVSVGYSFVSQKAEVATTALAVQEGSVGTVGLADLSVTTAKLANNAVTAAKLSSDTASLGKLTTDRLRLDGNNDLAVLNRIVMGRGKSIGHNHEAFFDYASNSVGYYSLGWYEDSWTNNGLTSYLSSYGGIKLFAGGSPRLTIDGLQVKSHVRNYIDNHGWGGVAGIDLAIGDEDTGFRWLSDGVLQMMGNGVPRLSIFETGQVISNGLTYIDTRGFGGSPTIDFAVGDSDTGIRWIGDGAIDLMSNGFPKLQIRTDGTTMLGNVHVAGTLTKSGGTFRIDHPLDPANKYLYHSFVESPDMKNVYDGVVTLGKGGAATVSLPEYFESLNRDFRYQLTCIGGHAPVYVAQEVKGNSFKIAGGTPGMKVSWQVTGIRKDPWAEQNRIVPEVAKPKEERGTYLFPNGYPSRLTDSKRGKE